MREQAQSRTCCERMMAKELGFGSDWIEKQLSEYKKLLVNYFK
jgi:hypothetical protein